MERRGKQPISERTTDIVFDPEDFDPNYNRAANASANLSKLFEDVVGREDVVRRLRGYQEVARGCKARNLDAREQIPMNFVFSGPPGKSRNIGPMDA